MPGTELPARLAAHFWPPVTDGSEGGAGIADNHPLVVQPATTGQLAQLMVR
jgi:hypothetical protein